MSQPSEFTGLIFICSDLWCLLFNVFFLCNDFVNFFIAATILKTVAVIPPGMYGELDPNNLMRASGRSVRNGIYYRIMGPLEAKI